MEKPRSSSEPPKSGNRGNRGKAGSVEEEGLEEGEGGDDAGRAVGERPQRLVVDVSLHAGNLRGNVEPGQRCSRG